MSDTEVLKHLSHTIVFVALLMWAAEYAPHRAKILGTVQWCSVVMLLHVLYGVAHRCIGICRCKARQRVDFTALSAPHAGLSTGQLHQSTYTDLPQMPPAGDSPTQEHVEMNPVSVYIYVYGWGILLFVCLYCAAGQIEGSSCWWVVGMLVLAFDELIARNVARLWVVTIGVLIYGSVASLWWAASGSKAVEQHLDGIILGTVLPVLVPFIFFSLRNPVRIVLRDVRVLYSTAVPFIVIISLGILVGTAQVDDYFTVSGQHGVRRHTNGSAIESGAPFHHSRPSNHAQWYDGYTATLNQTAHLANSILVHNTLLRPLVLLATPFIAERVLVTLVNCVMRGFVTEFITSFMLALSVKFAATHESTVASGIAIGTAGACFVLLVLLRRVI